MRELTWVVKASKLCNLRCSYCYEWNELSDPKRMQPPEWAHLFTSMKQHLNQERQRFPGLAARLTLVLHGGEPLLLPVDYLENVLCMTRAVFGEDMPRIALQTNLYVLSEAHLDLIARWQIEVGVSLDVVPGVRRSLNGKDTELRVKENLSRLRVRCAQVGAISVLAKHTAEQIEQVYAFFRDQRLPWRVLPLFRGPEERPAERVALPEQEIVQALERLFLLWIDDDERVPVSPLAEYFEVALRKLAGGHVAPYDPARTAMACCS